MERVVMVWGAGKAVRVRWVLMWSNHFSSGEESNGQMDNFSTSLKG